MNHQADVRGVNWALGLVPVLALVIGLFAGAGCSSDPDPGQDGPDSVADAMVEGDGGAGDHGGDAGDLGDGGLDWGEDGGAQCLEPLTLCDGGCVDLNIDPAHCGECYVECGQGVDCVDGLCGGGCPLGLLDCDGRCVNIQTDLANCGGCGVVCLSDEFCQGGSCTSRCSQGLSLCGDYCVNLSTDTSNCGECGLQCQVGEMCNRGECEVICYGEGRAVCDGACVDINTDSNNCGRCGNQCDEGLVCTGGTCVTNCSTGWIFCDGECVNSALDRFNCGDCGVLCGQGKVCDGGECIISCPDGMTACDGECVDLSIDPFHCGGCGDACVGGMVCLTGECVADCGFGLTKCDGGCVDLLINRSHCGQCGWTCAGTEICSEGECKVACPPDFTVCNDECKDLNSDNLNCGVCGNRCLGSELCTDGVCYSQVTRVRISPSELDLVMDETAQLSVRFTPADATVRGVTWESGDLGVASVDEDGLVTGVGEGITFIRVTSDDGGFTDQVEVQVRIPVTGLSLSVTHLSLRPGESGVIEPLFEPANATRRGVVWSLDMLSVATVDQNGMVSAVAEGEALVTAVSRDGGYVAECVVTVSNVPVTGIDLSVTHLDLSLNEQAQLVAVVSPNNASNQAVIWFSDDWGIASVDHTGLVTGTSGGHTFINVATKDGGFSARCSVNVQVPVTGILVNPPSLQIDKGSTYALEGEVVPEQASDKRIFWSSSDESVATVTVDGGVVTGVGAGNAIIQGVTAEGGYSDICELTVWAPVTGVSVSPKNAAIPVGGYVDLSVDLEPADASNTVVSFASGTPAVATVSSDGRVTGVSPGVASIIVRSMDGFKTDSAVIQVYVPVHGVSLSVGEVGMVRSEIRQLGAVVLPGEANNKRVVWESDDELVARVDTGGLVTAVGQGVTTVRVITEEGGFQDECTVTVFGGAGTQVDPYTALSLPASCAKYRQIHSGLHNGHYRINPKSGVELTVYCDMFTDGIGYTFHKVMQEEITYAAAAEAYCGDLGMRLFIPRTKMHLISAYMIATNGNIGPDGNANYLYIMGIYPKWKGAMCKAMPLVSSNTSCDWRAGDDGPFWVSDSSNINEPNGDNDIDSSMNYTFSANGEVSRYNDVVSPGYGSTRFICDTGDNY